MELLENYIGVRSEEEAKAGGRQTLQEAAESAMKDLSEADLQLKFELHHKAEIAYLTSPTHLANQMLRSFVLGGESAWICEINHGNREPNTQNLKGLPKIVQGWLIAQGFVVKIESSTDEGGQFGPSTSYSLAIEISASVAQRILQQFLASVGK